MADGDDGAVVEALRASGMAPEDIERFRDLADLGKAFSIDPPVWHPQPTPKRPWWKFWAAR